jgi:polyhydroxybutyrate depolymerase
VTARLLGLLGVLLVVSGCGLIQKVGTGSAFSEGTSVHNMTADGIGRSYRVYKPAGLPASAPLVVMLHGAFGSGEQAERAYGWDQLADAAKFIVAYPDGLSERWNVHGCCGEPARENIDDVGFITAMVDQIGAAMGVDRSRIYATGISNGGMMSYTLACNTAVFAAIGPDSATQLDACKSPHPTSVLHIHGTADRVIRYDGGSGEGDVQVDGPSVPDVNAFWRNVDRCAAPTVSTAGALTTSTAACADHRTVELITIDGGGHVWPPFATQTLWQFFAAH